VQVSCSGPPDAVQVTIQSAAGRIPTMAIAKFSSPRATASSTAPAGESPNVLVNVVLNWRPAELRGCQTRRGLLMEVAPGDPFFHYEKVGTVSVFCGRFI
jgi:hypothetical protein